MPKVINFYYTFGSFTSVLIVQVFRVADGIWEIFLKFSIFLPGFLKHKPLGLLIV